MDSYQLLKLSIDELGKLKQDINNIIYQKHMDEVTNELEKWNMKIKVRIMDYEYHKVGYEATELLVTFMLNNIECGLCRRNIYEEYNPTIVIGKLFTLRDDDDETMDNYVDFCLQHSTSKKEIMKVCDFINIKFE